MKKIHAQRGFTLVELIISIGLFAIVTTITAAAYLNLINLDRRTRSADDLINNMTFVINSMASSIRTGTNYLCVDKGDANGNGLGCSQFQFTDSNGCVTKYSISQSPSTHTTVVNETQTAQSQGNTACTNTGPLTDPRINITSLSFNVTGVGDDSFEPQVVFSVEGTLPIGSTGQLSSFTLQTTASERGIDIYSHGGGG